MMRKKRSYDEKRERLFLLTTGNIVCIMVCRGKNSYCVIAQTLTLWLHFYTFPDIQSVCKNISETFKSSFWSVLENRRRIKTVL